MSGEIQNKVLFQQVVVLLKNAQQQVIRTINSTMVYTYFEIGRMIVEEEQNGMERAAYGKQVLKELSKELTKEFGKGFSVDNLQNMRRLYFIYSNYETLSSNLKINAEKSETVSRISIESKKPVLTLNFILTWSHYIFLLIHQQKFEE